MPGKFSRHPTTPNKPPVCHKAPIEAWPDPFFPWSAPANLYFAWKGSTYFAPAQRSWALQMTPNTFGREQAADSLADGIGFRLRLHFEPDAKLFYFNAMVYDSVAPLMLEERWLNPVSARHGWSTGIIEMHPSTFTDSCSFEVLA